MAANRAPFQQPSTTADVCQVLVAWQKVEADDRLGLAEAVGDVAANLAEGVC